MVDQSQTSEVEAFFFKRMMQFCLGISIFNIIGNVIVGLDFITNVKWIVLIPIATVGLEHKENDSLRPWFLSILYCFVIFLFIPSGWKTTGGYNYLTLGYVLLVAMSIGFLLKGKLRLLFAGLELCVFLFLAYLQYNDPNFVDVVPQGVHLMDLYIQTPIIFLTVIYMSTVFAQAYQNERDRLKLYSELLADRNRALEIISRTDELTGLYNRRFLFEKLESIVKSKGEATIIMMDIDDFKYINDGFGHLVGDEVIIQVSHCIRDEVGKLGSVGRYGGDEFVIVLEGITDRTALHLTDTIQTKVQSLPLGIDRRVSVSGGITKLGPDSDLDRALSSADEVMYWVKQNGKGRIVEVTETITSESRIG